MPTSRDDSEQGSSAALLGSRQFGRRALASSPEFSRRTRQPPGEPRRVGTHSGTNTIRTCRCRPIDAGETSPARGVPGAEPFRGLVRGDPGALSEPGPPVRSPGKHRARRPFIAALASLQCRTSTVSAACAHPSAFSVRVPSNISSGAEGDLPSMTAGPSVPFTTSDRQCVDSQRHRPRPEPACRPRSSAISGSSPQPVVAPARTAIGEDARADLHVPGPSRTGEAFRGDASDLR